MKCLGRPWPAYLAGQLSILAGAALMDVADSYMPMALGGSAAILLTMPLLRHITHAARERARR
jgi:hypothetical protein